MSTDENLVARNQETAEANGLAAAHTRGTSTSSSSSSSSSASTSPLTLRPPVPGVVSSLFCDRMPIEIQLCEKHSAIAISVVRRHSRLVAYRNGNSLCTRLAFDDRFFERSMSRPARSRFAREAVSNLILVTENRAAIARLGLSLSLSLIAIVDSRLSSVIYRSLALHAMHLHTWRW